MKAKKRGFTVVAGGGRRPETYLENVTSYFWLIIFFLIVNPCGF
jgi:hypothetical protein